jgi:hypothetical protein
MVASQLRIAWARPFARWWRESGVRRTLAVGSRFTGRGGEGFAGPALRADRSRAAGITEALKLTGLSVGRAAPVRIGAWVTLSCLDGPAA